MPVQYCITKRTAEVETQREEYLIKAPNHLGESILWNGSRRLNECGVCRLLAGSNHHGRTLTVTFRSGQLLQLS